MKDTNLLTSNGVNLDASLELFGDLTSYEETLKDYLNGVGKKVEDLKKYREDGNLSDYAIVVHSLKSDARYLGFTKLQELAYNHEMESKANNMLYVNDHFEELMTETSRITDLVKQYMGSTYSVQTQESSKVQEQGFETTGNAILVVDDSIIIRNFINKASDHSLEIINAADGKEAIDYVSNNKQIIGMLLDLNMPNVDGFEVLEYLKSNNYFSSIAVSIITGEDSKEVISKAFTYPIVDVLTKPFTDKDVQRIIEKTIEFSKKA